MIFVKLLLIHRREVELTAFLMHGGVTGTRNRRDASTQIDRES